MAKLQKERGLTYLFIAHDLSVMRFICDRIAVIYKGELQELSETETLFATPSTPTPGPSSPPSPSPTPSPSGRRCWRSTTPPATVTARRTLPCGRRWSPATSSGATRAELDAYRARL